MSKLTNELAAQAWCTPETEDREMDATLALAVAAIMHDKAYDVVQDNIQNDAELAWAWHCNVAVPMMDEHVDHAAANKAATRIMRTLFGVDTEPMVRERLPNVFAEVQNG